MCVVIFGGVYTRYISLNIAARIVVSLIILFQRYTKSCSDFYYNVSSVYICFLHVYVELFLSDAIRNAADSPRGKLILMRYVLSLAHRLHSETYRGRSVQIVLKTSVQIGAKIYTVYQRCR